MRRDVSREWGCRQSSAEYFYPAALDQRSSPIQTNSGHSTRQRDSFRIRQQEHSVMRNVSAVALRLDIRSFLVTSNRSRVYETMAGLNRNVRLLGTIFTASLIIALCLSRQCEG